MTICFMFILILAVFMLFGPNSTGESQAAVIDNRSQSVLRNGEISPYPHSTEISRRLVKFNNVPFTNLSFETRSPISRVAQFYKSSLIRGGWTDFAGLSAGRDFFILGKAGQICVVVLSQDSERGITKTKGTITYCDVQKEDWSKLVAQTDHQDVPGGDPQGIPRYPLSRRALSFAESGSGDKSRMALYSSRHSSDTQLAFYRAQMAARGWKADLENEYASGRAQPLHAGTGRALSFTQGRKECQIIIQDAPGSAGANTLVLYKE